jgi:hypothetical protein
LHSAQALKTLRVPPHLASLLGQGGDLTWQRLLPGPAAVKHLLGFLPRGQTAEGRQTKGAASGIRGLAHAVLLGHPKQRFDSLGADGQADVIQPQCLGSLECERELGVQRQA